MARGEIIYNILGINNVFMYIKLQGSIYKIISNVSLNDHTMLLDLKYR